MAPVGVWLPWTETLLLAARFGMDAHTCEAAAQSWASIGLAELDPLPRHCKGPTDYTRIRCFQRETKLMQHTLLARKASIGGGRQHRTSCHKLSMRSMAKISILICLDTSLHSSGGINCPCQTTSLRLWLSFPSASYHAAFQIISQNMIVHARNPSFSGCFDNSTCFPNSPLLSRAMCFRRRSP